MAPRDKEPARFSQRAARIARREVGQKQSVAASSPAPARARGPGLDAPFDWDSLVEHPERWDGMS
jgi:hypothetical protein